MDPIANTRDKASSPPTPIQISTNAAGQILPRIWVVAGSTRIALDAAMTPTSQSPATLPSITHNYTALRSKILGMEEITPPHCKTRLTH